VADRLQQALNAYREGKISIGKASEIAGLPITIFLDELKRAGILLNYTKEDLMEDAKWARQSSKESERPKKR
jgi:predicted HTH domain antitoxin